MRERADDKRWVWVRTRLVAAGFYFALLGPAWALANSIVSITGGADASGHTYSWQVHNGGALPIVEVRFPHYRAGLFFPPPGWSNDCTALVHVGAKDEPGICTARAAAPADGITPGRSAAFSMQIAPAGAKRGPGEVTVRFADGNETRVAGVELPQQEGLGDKYVSLIALGGVFIVFVAVQAIRKRRPQVSRADEGRAAGTESR